MTSCRAITALMCAQFALFAQQTIPHISCAGDGQAGPFEADPESKIALPISATDARQLAYYSASRVGVLGPRGWHCFFVYGSGGATLYVTPQPLDAAKFFSSQPVHFGGPIIEVSTSLAETSGRYSVAKIIARLFPSRQSFVNGVRELYDFPESEFPIGPHKADTLTYRNKDTVEFKTPANTDGLGTHLNVAKDTTPIVGVAILVDPGPDALILAIRLPKGIERLAPTIVRQFERDAPKESLR